MPQGCERAAAEAAALVPPSRGAYKIVTVVSRSTHGRGSARMDLSMARSRPRSEGRVWRPVRLDHQAGAVDVEDPEFLDGLSVVRVRTPLPLQRRRHRHRGRHRPRMWTLDLAAGVSGYADRVHRCGRRGLDVSRCDAPASGKAWVERGAPPASREQLGGNKDGGVGTPTLLGGPRGGHRLQPVALADACLRTAARGQGIGPGWGLGQDAESQPFQSTPRNRLSCGYGTSPLADGM